MFLDNDIVLDVHQKTLKITVVFTMVLRGIIIYHAVIVTIIYKIVFHYSRLYNIFIIVLYI